MPVFADLPFEIQSLINIELAYSTQEFVNPYYNWSSCPKFDPKCGICQMYRAYDIALARGDKYAVKRITKHEEFLNTFVVVSHFRKDIILGSIAKSPNPNRIKKCTVYVAVSIVCEPMLKWCIEQFGPVYKCVPSEVLHSDNTIPAMVRLMEKYRLTFSDKMDFDRLANAELYEAVKTIDGVMHELLQKQQSIIENAWFNERFDVLEWCIQNLDGSMALILTRIQHSISTTLAHFKWIETQPIELNAYHFFRAIESFSSTNQPTPIGLLEYIFNHIQVSIPESAFEIDCWGHDNMILPDCTVGKDMESVVQTAWKRYDFCILDHLIEQDPNTVSFLNSIVENRLLHAFKDHYDWISRRLSYSWSAEALFELLRFGYYHSEDMYSCILKEYVRKRLEATDK